MLKYKLLVIFLSALLFTCCKNNPEIKDFTYKYSMESSGNFKIEFQLNPDSTYQIVQNNYFFDRYEGVNHPLESTGSLSKDEFKEFRKLIQNSNIYSMKDSYGFSENENIDNSILYIIELIRNGQSKYVSVNASTQQNFPTEFTRLIEYTNKFINANMNK